MQYLHGMTERSEAEAAARAERRASWPVRVGTLEAPPRDNLAATTTVADRIAMMWPLAFEAWTFAGLPIPDYRRQDAPIVVTRAGDPNAHD